MGHPGRHDLWHAPHPHPKRRFSFSSAIHVSLRKHQALRPTRATSQLVLHHLITAYIFSLDLRLITSYVGKKVAPAHERSRLALAGTSRQPGTVTFSGRVALHPAQGLSAGLGSILTSKDILPVHTACDVTATRGHAGKRSLQTVTF